LDAGHEVKMGVVAQNGHAVLAGQGGNPGVVRWDRSGSLFQVQAAAFKGFFKPPFGTLRQGAVSINAWPVIRAKRLSCLQTFHEASR
jgi:hypothetical protein